MLLTSAPTSPQQTCLRTACSCSQSLFSGIGGDMVCLKRLKIAIGKIIHVEWDKVATHVFKSNHDPAYGGNLPSDGIEFVYYPSFEHVSENLDEILKDHKGK
jgi:site-specific DNA-cytosine methylase